MHLRPVWVLLIVLAVAWRWAWVGAAIFLGYSVWYLLVFWGRFPASVYVVMAGPPALVGLLFLLRWSTRAQPCPRH
jgi:hypothetical protein